jgi:hypothetical protein
MRDRISLWCIKLARRMTTWGHVDDYLAEALEEQISWIEYKKEDY